MNINDVLAQTTITGFSNLDETNILNSISTIYNSSSTAKILIDNYISTGEIIKIQYENGVAEVRGLYTGIIFLDPQYISTFDYITPTGKAIEASLTHVIAHEFGHALNPDLLIDDANYITDYKGKNVIFTNQILNELGIPERLSYRAITSRESEISLIRDYEYTNGEAIDRAYVNSIDLEDSLRNNITVIDSSVAGNSRDLLIADNKGNTLISGDGDDFLYGGDGDDILDGGAGNDKMYGRKGDDTYYVDSLGDVVIEKPSEGFDVIKNSNIDIYNTFRPDNVELIQLIDTNPNKFLSLVKKSLYNLNYSGGNLSQSELEKGINREYLIENQTEGIEYYFEGANTPLNVLAPFSVGSNKFYGVSNQSNTIYSGVGDDILYGGNQDDILSGGFGTNTLFGGGGADTFVLSPDSTQIVADFELGIDKIDATAVADINMGTLLLFLDQNGNDVDIRTDIPGQGVIGIVKNTFVEQLTFRDFINGSNPSSSSAKTNLFTGDFTGDGITPILQSLIASAGSNFIIVGTGDYNGIGKSDIFFKDPLTGENATWLMNGTNANVQSFIPSAGSKY